MINKSIFLIFFTLIKVYNVYSVDSTAQQWLGCVPSSRLESLLHISFHDMPEYREKLVPYLKARGVEDEKAIEHFFRQDLFHIVQAFSILFEQDSNLILHNFLGEYSHLVDGLSTQIDHVGREFFGPISFYLPMLKQISPQLGFTYVRELVFASTQVVKVLQENDPTLAGVTIARVYFHDSERNKIRCLELFQAAPQDEKSPQIINATIERLALLTASRSESKLTPIDHISVELNSVADVQNVHSRILQLSCGTLMSYQKEISHNPGDGSTQTKALLRDSIEAPFNKIVEFVHYAK